MTASATRASGDSLFVAGIHTLIAIASGVVVALLLTMAMIVFEPWLLKPRGHRRPSRRETEILENCYHTVGAKMGITELQPILIAEREQYGAWTHTRHIVIARGVLAEDQEVIGAVLAHDLRHWDSGDTVGLTFVKMAALPTTISMNICSRFAKTNHQSVALVFMFLFWPFYLMARFLFRLAIGYDRRSTSSGYSMICWGRETVNRAESRLFQLSLSSRRAQLATTR
jgi:Zn-dependent protease with chaperone function